jgi:transposase
MPWETSNVMGKRYEFIQQFRDEECSLAELCREHGISRKTGCKWLERFEECGLGGLGDRSSSPLHHPNQLSPEVETEILAMRGKHPTWGPKKLLKSLSRHGPEKEWPARSTIGALLQRKGLTHPQKNKARVTAEEQGLSTAQRRTLEACRCAEPGVVHGFQRVVSLRRQELLLSADDDGCL